VISVAAQAYVMRYEDQAVEPALAERAKAIMVDFNRRVVSALDGDASERLRAANTVAMDYEWHVPDF